MLPSYASRIMKKGEFRFNSIPCKINIFFSPLLSLTLTTQFPQVFFLVIFQLLSLRREKCLIFHTAFHLLMLHQYTTAHYFSTMGQAGIIGLSVYSMLFLCCS